MTDRPTDRPTVGSIFSGIGGFDLAFERAGFRVLWQIEIDPSRQQVLRARFPGTEIFSDVSRVDTDAIARPHILCGGFPCQDISSAGRRTGIRGKSSGLWSEYRRLIRALRPSYVVVENAAALTYDGRGLDVVLGELAEIRYDAEWDCLPAAAFGADHQRDRIILVAYPHAIRGCEWRLPLQPLGGPERRDPADVEHDGEVRSVSHVARERRTKADRAHGPRESHAARQASAPVDHHEDGRQRSGLPVSGLEGAPHADAGWSDADAADAVETGRPIVFGSEARESFARLRSADGRGRRDAQPALVRTLHGLSYRVGHTHVHATVKDKAKRRRERHSAQVAALGDAVYVPVIAWIAEQILSAERRLAS